MSNKSVHNERSFCNIRPMKSPSDKLFANWSLSIMTTMATTRTLVMTNYYNSNQKFIFIPLFHILWDNDEQIMVNIDTSIAGVVVEFSCSHGILITHSHGKLHSKTLHQPQWYPKHDTLFARVHAYYGEQQWLYGGDHGRGVVIYLKLDESTKTPTSTVTPVPNSILCLDYIAITICLFCHVFQIWMELL